MNQELGSILRLFGETMKDPAGVARMITALRLPHTAGWLGLAIVTILTVIAVYLETMVPGQPEVLVAMGQRPFFDTFFLGALSVVFIFMVYYAGRAMGGQGTFGATLLTMTWFQTIVLILITIQLISVVIVPGLAGLVTLIVFAAQIWCLLHFINVLHNFDSLVKALVMLFVSAFGLAMGLALIIMLVGGAAAVGGV